MLRPPRPPGGGQTALPPNAAPMARRPPPAVTAPIPVVPRTTQALTPIAPGAAAHGPRRLEDFRGQRQESDQGGRTVITEPGRVIVVDPSGQAFVRHDEDERFRFGARDIQTQRVGDETRTIVVRPDGSQIITIVGADGGLLRRMRRDARGDEIVIIDNCYRDPRAVGSFYVDLPPPVVRIPYNRYIVDADVARPDVIYETMEAPPVDRIDRRYTLDEIRYSPNVRMLMPSIDVNTINFDLGSWEIPPDQAARLQAIADGLNRAIQRNPREVFLIEGHTDAIGNDTRQPVAVRSPCQIGGRTADPAIRRAGGKPDLAGLRLAISEGTDRRAEPHQPARHRPPHHAAAQWRAWRRCRRRRPASRRRARASCLENAKWPGAIPAIFSIGICPLTPFRFGAFSSEVESGSREEHASKQKIRARF